MMAGSSKSSRGGGGLQLSLGGIRWMGTAFSEHPAHQLRGRSCGCGHGTHVVRGIGRAEASGLPGVGTWGWQVPGHPALLWFLKAASVASLLLGSKCQGNGPSAKAVQQGTNRSGRCGLGVGGLPVRGDERRGC